MINRKNTNTKKPKFNFYWIYAIIAIILISINLFSWDSGIHKTTLPEFDGFIEQKHVRRVEVINQKEARVYIYPEYLDHPPHNAKNIPDKSSLRASSAVFLALEILKS